MKGLEYSVEECVVKLLQLDSTLNALNIYHNDDYNEETSYEGIVVTVTDDGIASKGAGSDVTREIHDVTVKILLRRIITAKASSTQDDLWRRIDNQILRASLPSSSSSWSSWLLSYTNLALLQTSLGTGSSREASDGRSTNERSYKCSASLES